MFYLLQPPWVITPHPKRLVQPKRAPSYIRRLAPRRRPVHGRYVARRYAPDNFALLFDGREARYPKIRAVTGQKYGRLCIPAAPADLRGAWRISDREARRQNTTR